MKQNGEIWCEHTNLYMHRLVHAGLAHLVIALKVALMFFAKVK